MISMLRSQKYLKIMYPNELKSPLLSFLPSYSSFNFHSKTYRRLIRASSLDLNVMVILKRKGVLWIYFIVSKLSNSNVKPNQPLELLYQTKREHYIAPGGQHRGFILKMWYNLHYQLGETPNDRQGARDHETFNQHSTGWIISLFILIFTKHVSFSLSLYIYI